MAQYTPAQEEKRRKVSLIVERLIHTLEYSKGYSKQELLKTLVEKLSDTDIDSLVFAIEMTPLPEKLEKEDTSK